MKDICGESSNPDDVAWYVDNSDSTMPLGLKESNELGLGCKYSPLHLSQL
jgi:hypothetical protein